MLGMGAAGVAAGLVSGFAVNASTSRSFAIADAGDHPQVVGLAGAALVAVTLLFLSPLFAQMPLAALGGVTVVVALGLIYSPSSGGFGRFDRTDLVLALVTAAGVGLESGCSRGSCSSSCSHCWTSPDAPRCRTGRCWCMFRARTPTEASRRRGVHRMTPNSPSTASMRRCSSRTSRSSWTTSSDWLAEMATPGARSLSTPRPSRVSIHGRSGTRRDARRAPEAGGPVRSGKGQGPAARATGRGRVTRAHRRRPHLPRGGRRRRRHGRDPRPCGQRPWGGPELIARGLTETGGIRLRIRAAPGR